MPIICRLLGLSPDDAATLVAEPSLLAERVATAHAHSDVYRYWDGIQFLLVRHRPESPAAHWLALGEPVPALDEALPDDRVITAADVATLDALLQDIAPDDLAAYYDAEAMDLADVYPATWQAWEEDFDPLGQMLEHYFFLQQFVSRCATARDALLLHFEAMDEGSV